jgi:hypothetical protein
MYDHVIWTGGDSSDSHRTSIAPRIDFEGVGLDAAIPTLSVRQVGRNMMTTLTCTLKES